MGDLVAACAKRYQVAYGVYSVFPSDSSQRCHVVDSHSVRREHCIDILRADGFALVVAEEVIAGGQTADDDHVRAAGLGYCPRYLFHYLSRREFVVVWAWHVTSLVLLDGE